MDNPTAGRLIGLHRALEQPADVLGLIRPKAKMPAVNARVRVTARDEDGLLFVLFQESP